MNLLVSDYDQTLLMDDITIKINLYKIREFQKNGNLFMLSTGRDYSSIEKEIKKFNIPYDYLSCADGVSLYDSNNNLVSFSELSKNDLRISEYFKLKYKSKIKIFDIKPNGLDIPVTRLIQINDIHYKSIIEETKNFFDKNMTDSDYTSKYNFIIIKPKSINKSTTINHIETKLEIPKKNIFTIGYHDNDYEMIHDYNGFTMWWGSKKVKECALKQYPIMSQLIDDIEKNDEEFQKRLRFK